ncbi:hypothetical protein DBV15_11072 [Temnothorax longispinosus]|uniref:Uncharacterized protein n=1 Tax=Temnothorax longispinosus TaxID=300112 RepID=A0A4S2KSX8_9HYME|nr:hypothetical protein DBV15_11072 [Temnothorax longispinosus]
MVSKRDQDEKEEEEKSKGPGRGLPGWDEKSFVLRVQRSARPFQRERRYAGLYFESRELIFMNPKTSERSKDAANGRTAMRRDDGQVTIEINAVGRTVPKMIANYGFSCKAVVSGGVHIVVAAYTTLFARMLYGI